MAECHTSATRLTVMLANESTREENAEHFYVPIKDVQVFLKVIVQ